jgi:hypothetical protein
MTQLLRDYLPALKYGAKVLSSEVLSGLNDFANVFYVDGNNGSDSNNGTRPDLAFATIQAAITAASSDDTIYVRAKSMAATDTDPNSYTENLVIPAGKSRLRILGLGHGPVQGGVPQVKVGTTTTQALLTVRSPGVLIAGLGFNGAGATGGGILLDDDGGATKTAFGTSILDCHFKNCVGTTATNAATGGAIQWPAAGNAWQIKIAGNRFYKNVGDIVMKGTGSSVPQDVVIENNIFSGPAASVDCNIYTGGDGINGLIIRDNYFTADPAIGSASNGNFLMLTGSVGILANNFFACITEEADTEITFGATGVNKVPTTVFMASNFGEWGTAGTPGVGSGEIFRT